MDVARWATVLDMADDDPRVLISSLRIRTSALIRVDALADERDWSRAEALRYLLALGLKAHEAQRATPAPVRRAAPDESDDDFAARHARLQKPKGGGR
jgi:hypothetical protein